LALSTNIPDLGLFPNSILRCFVSPQSEKNRLTQLVVAGPLGKLDLRDQYWFDPDAPFHDFCSDAPAPSAFAFLRQICEWADLTDDLLQAAVQCLQSFSEKPVPTLPANRSSSLS
jgi:hypothetical protein